MLIRAKTMKAQRERLGITQSDLAEKARLSISTIKRIEGANGDYKANPRVAKRIADELKVKPEDLAREPHDVAQTEAVLKESGYRRIKALVDGDTAMAFQIVEHLYGISPQSQILMAPLFAALLAEGSLAWRRQKLTEVEDAIRSLSAIAEGHLSFAVPAYRAEEGAVCEHGSIARRDLFGKGISEDAISQGYDPSQRNPFSDYLREFAGKVGMADIEFSPYGIDSWKTPEGMPDYKVGEALLEKLTDGDRWAEFALTRGHARLREIPEELLGDDATNKRVSWLADKVPPEEKAKHEAWLSKLNIDL